MINVGDKVRLTGEEWGAYSVVHPGDIVEVTEIDETNIWAGAAGTVGNQNGLYSESNPEPSGNYSCELVTDTPAEHFAKTSTKERAILEETATRVFGEPQTVYDISSFEQSVRYHTGKIADLLISKNLSYGDSALNPIRVFSKADRMEQLYTRLDDKLSRVQKGHEYPGDDTIRDIIGYCTLILIAREGE